MSRPCLEARGLAVSIGGRQVVAGLDLSVRPGERLAILGRNGVGKSTLLATLAGLRPPAAGFIGLGGDELAGLPPRIAARRRAWLGQFHHDAFDASVLDTALAGRHPHLGRWAWETPHDAELARAALAAVGLAGFESRSVLSLSGGERQRLAIATLLTQQAPLLLLDEPLAHLDLHHQMAVLRLLAGAVSTGTGRPALIMVLHDPALAYRFCDRALLLDGAGGATVDAVDRILDAPTLSTLYGHPLRQIDDGGWRTFLPE